MIDRKIVFIGAGNMAYACVSGFLKSNTVKGSNIGIYDIDITKFDSFAGLNINKFSDLGAAVLFADYIILAVKPQVITQCLEQISKATDFSDKVFISFAAGISTSYVSKCLGGNVSVIRMMPNTPFLVGKGTVAISKNEFVSKSSFQFICTLFASIASVTVLNEDMMNKVISLNGSSPAYFFLFYKSMLESALKFGFSKKDARELILSTMIGSVEMLKENSDVDLLIKNVTSPKGTTEASLNVLYQNEFSDIIEKCMIACVDRADELSLD